MARHVIVPLLTAARRGGSSRVATSGCEKGDAAIAPGEVMPTGMAAAAAPLDLDGWVAARAVASLSCVIANRKFFALSPSTVDAIRTVVAESRCKGGGTATTTARVETLRSAILNMRQVGCGAICVCFCVMYEEIPLLPSPLLPSPLLSSPLLSSSLPSSSLPDAPRSFLLMATRNFKH